jgi:toxin ParE1/3/4
MKPVVFLSAAEAELNEAQAYIDAQRTGLGESFLIAINEAIKRIRKNPRGFQRYRRTGYRFCIVRRFRYVIYFRELADRIRIVAVAHGSRRPGYWRRREID